MSEFELNNDSKEDLAKSDPNSTAQDYSDKTPSKKKKTTSFFEGLIEQLELIVLALGMIILIFSFFGRTCQVSGDSMVPTLTNNNRVFISDVFYTPDRNDIVVFHQTNFNDAQYNEPIVKRVIGLPGDTVKIEYFDTSMKVTVTKPDGTSTVLNEDYIQYTGERIYQNSETYVEEGTVFVMGDNRCKSADSRSSKIGLVDTRRILGKVILRVTPVSQFGTVK